MLSSNPHRLSFQELQLLKVVAKRVADKPLEAVVNGPACTDGKTICLPIEPPQFSLKELIGITSHESSHLRFHTIFGTNIQIRVCPQNPSLGAVVLNILEDARVDSLLKEAYLGFWVELDHANRRQALRSVEQMSTLPEDILHSNSTANFLLRLMNLDLTGNISLLFTNNLRLPSGRFKFAAKALARFWDVFLDAKQYLLKYRTFPATVIAGRKVIKAIEQLLSEFQKEKEEEAKKGESNEEHYDAEESDQGSSSSRKDQNRRESSLEDRNLGENQGSEDPDGDIKLSEGGEVTPGEPEQGDINQESPDIPPSLASQTLEVELKSKPAPAQPSGINYDELEGQERTLLEELEHLLQETDLDGDQLQEKLEEKLELARKDMQDILNHIKEEAASIPSPKQVEKCNEDGREIEVHVIDTAAALQEANHVSNPEERYARIIKAHKYTIDQLRRQLQQIKTKTYYERGGRRGIVCYRDLARVVSSKGTFNRPFLTPQNTQGADLLILVDESYSMCVNGDHDEELYEEEEVYEGYEGDEDGDEDEFEEEERENRSKTMRREQDQRPISVAKQSAIILSEALKDTRIAFGVVGFTAMQNRPVIAEKVYKRFEESADPVRLGSIWCSSRYTENRDGTSFSTIFEHHFKNSQGKVPIMVIISDGQPNHGGTAYVGHQAIKHTTETVRGLKQRVKMFMLSIDIAAQSYLKDIYGKGNYIVLNDPAELTQKLIYLVKCIAANLS